MVNALLFAYLIPRAIAYARGRERFKPYAEKTKKKIGKGRERMHRFLQRAQSERGRSDRSEKIYSILKNSLFCASQHSNNHICKRNGAYGHNKTKKKIGKGRERMHRFLQRAQSERGRRILGSAFLFVLVVVPLPGMGSMTAALLGTLFHISSKDMFWAIFTGNTVVAVCTVALADVIIAVL